MAGMLANLGGIHKLRRQALGVSQMPMLLHGGSTKSTHHLYSWVLDTHGWHYVSVQSPLLVNSHSNLKFLTRGRPQALRSFIDVYGLEAIGQPQVKKCNLI